MNGPEIETFEVKEADDFRRVDGFLATTSLNFFAASPMVGKIS
jgi:hypothetical protein